MLRDIDLRGGFELLVKVWDRGRRNEGTMTLVRSSDMIRGMQLSPNGSYILHGMVGTLCYTGLRPFCIKDNGKGHPAQTWKTNNGHSVSAPDVSKVTAGSGCEVRDTNTTWNRTWSSVAAPDVSKVTAGSYDRMVYI
ncbi:hypothetical protein Tco_0432466 [Tanacetum coccineum]